MKQGCKKRRRIMLHTRRVVAMFGRAKLMRDQDEAAAIEWASMFMPEAVLARPRQTTR